jgi:hypothetical protein
MKKVTYFIDPETNSVNGYTYKVYSDGELIPSIPRFLVNENNQTTGIMYVEPLCVVTGYNPDYKYKTYNPETNSFI